MTILKSDLITQNHTKIEYEESYAYHAPNSFKVRRVEDNEMVCEIKLQQGPVNEYGVNGAANEDLIAIVIERLSKFQEGKYKCRENACAITKLEESLMWLRKRINSREQRGVEGTPEQ